MRGTGRFNLAQGAGSSNLFSGFVVQAFGYTIGFVTLALVAVAGLIFFTLLMPETKPPEETGLTPGESNTPAPTPA